MAPDAENCEEVDRLNGDYTQETTHQGRRVLPDGPTPARAWTESEELGPGNDSRTSSPGENRRLLGNKPPQKATSRLQVGLTLGVWGVKKQKCSSLKKSSSGTGIKREKTKFQKRKEKLKDILKPPYFIITMLLAIVMVHLCVPEDLRAMLEWAPEAWWQQPWRLFTYGLVHAGHTHLALNALVALAVGWRLEREQGWSQVAVVWAGGIAAGALGTALLQPGVRVVGASAAVYALLTAHLPNVCLRFGHIPLWWFRPLSVVVLGTSEVCWALLRAPDAHVPDHHVAWSAHALGAAVGLPLGFIVFTGENSSRKIIACRVLSVALLAGGLIATLAHYALRRDARWTYGIKWLISYANT